MSSAPAAGLAEQLVEGPVPRYELAEWRSAWGITAGITSAATDLGLWTATPVGQVMERWREFRGSQPGFRATVLAHQVHGARVLEHTGATGWQIHDGADGHVTAERGVLLAVTVADCIPVYVAAPAHGGVALLHAGWRGTAGGILTAGVDALCRMLGCSPADLVVHAGVGICGGCYEVGAEVVRACGSEPGGAGPWHVDLRDRLAAEATGLGVQRISRSDWCTAHDGPRFHSHRASGGRAGRMVAYLGLPVA